MIYLIIADSLSVILNILFIWYIRRILVQLLFVSENTENMLDSLNEFSTHLEKVHSLETYYGDLTLQNLINHSKKITEELGEYRIIYNLDQEETTMDL